MKPKHTITKSIKVGIYDSEYIAKIYKDKITVVLPYVRWVGNTGSYAESKELIRDRAVVDKISSELANGSEDLAMELILDYLFH